MKSYHWALSALITFSVFLVTAHKTISSDAIPFKPLHHDRVVISAPLQVLLYGGDRFLAADVETMRLASTASVSNDIDAVNYLVRAHLLVAQLNPCHEDNYYLGNALLTWGGAVDEGNELLRRATDCRTWDEFPPFFYGFNQYHFHRNIPEAKRALELAAQRSPENYAALMKSAIMLVAGEIDDDQQAAKYLKQQLDQSKDPKLRLLLEKRLVRMEGLIILRSAQKQFEKQFQRDLRSPAELIESGLLSNFPIDPLGLGYVFRDGAFMFKQIRISGIEDKR